MAAHLGRVEGARVSVQGFEAGPDTDTHSNYNEIGPDYFRTIGVPLLAGREFTRADATGTAKVAITASTAIVTINSTSVNPLLSIIFISFRHCLHSLINMESYRPSSG